jgi:hypothetical protein
MIPLKGMARMAGQTTTSANVGSRTAAEQQGERLLHIHLSNNSPTLEKQGGIFRNPSTPAASEVPVGVT